MDYQKYLRSGAWARRRQEALDRAEHRCQICNSRRRLHVHHRTYERLGDERPADLTVLCERCHGLFHKIVPEPRKRERRRKPKREPKKPELRTAAPSAPMWERPTKEPFVPKHIREPGEWNRLSGIPIKKVARG